MDYKITLEAAVPAYAVESTDEAVSVAITRLGEQLNPDMSYVDVEKVERSCPHCGESVDPALVAADEGLVALELSLTVFDVENEEHAVRVAKKEVGDQLKDIPLVTVDIRPIDEGSTDGDVERAEEGEDEPPEFDELIEA